MNNLYTVVVCTVSSVLLSGCLVTTKQLQRVEARMLRVDARVSGLEGTAEKLEDDLSTKTQGAKEDIFARLAESSKVSAETRRRLDRIEQQLRTVLGEIDGLKMNLEAPRAGTQATVLGRIEMLEQIVRTLQGDVREQVGRVDTVVSGLAAEVPKAEDLYEKARDLYKQQQWIEAQDDFELLIRKYPEHSLVPNAYFWLGECFFKQKEWVSALEQYKKVMDDFAGSNKVPDAYYKTVAVLVEMKEVSLAKSIAAELKEKHPKSSAAEKVQSLLK